MDQQKCINDVMTKYEDFPTIQKDIKKVIGYVESAYRMMGRRLLKGEESPETNPGQSEHDSIKGLIGLTDASFADDLAAVKSQGLNNFMPRDPFCAIAKIVTAYPLPLREDLGETAKAIFVNTVHNCHETLRDPRDAQDNGVTDVEYVRLLADHYLAPLQEKHPEADPAQLRESLVMITTIAERVLSAHTNGLADRLIETHRQKQAEVANV